MKVRVFSGNEGSSDRSGCEKQGRLKKSIRSGSDVSVIRECLDSCTLARMAPKGHLTFSFVVDLQNERLAAEESIFDLQEIRIAST